MAANEKKPKSRFQKVKDFGKSVKKKVENLIDFGAVQHEKEWLDSCQLTGRDRYGDPIER